MYSKNQSQGEKKCFVEKQGEKLQIWYPLCEL